MASTPDHARHIAWATTLVATALTLLWVASLLCVVRVPVPRATVRLCYGSIDIFSPPTNPPGFSVTLYRAFPPFVLPGWGMLRGGPYAVLPLWAPAALLGWVALGRIRRAYSVPPGQCPVCRYDLRGNVSGRCPECGTATLPAG